MRTPKEARRAGAPDGFSLDAPLKRAQSAGEEDSRLYNPPVLRPAMGFTLVPLPLESERHSGLPLKKPGCEHSTQANENRAESDSRPHL